LNRRVLTEVLGLEKVTVVLFEASKMAVPVGTVAAVQLVPVFQSPVGLQARSRLLYMSRDCAEEYEAYSTNTSSRSIRNM
jgi:hypothetical protein